MEPKSSLPHSWVPSTSPYPEPARSNPYPTSHFLKIRLNIIGPSTPGSPQWPLSPTKTLFTPLPLPIRATCPANLIFLDFNTRTILGEKYRTLSSSLCSFLHSRYLIPLRPKHSPQHPPHTHTHTHFLSRTVWCKETLYRHGFSTGGLWVKRWGLLVRICKAAGFNCYSECTICWAEYRTKWQR